MSGEDVAEPAADIRILSAHHFNPLNASVLPRFMNAFETAGWQWIDASLAFEDAVSAASRRPCLPEKVWSGRLPRRQGVLRIASRYPGEDDVYEKPKIDALVSSSSPFARDKRVCVKYRVSPTLFLFYSSPLSHSER